MTTIEQIIELSGLRKNFIAEGIGISQQSLCNKLKGRRRFTNEEIPKLATILMMPERMIRKSLR